MYFNNLCPQSYIGNSPPLLADNTNSTFTNRDMNFADVLLELFNVPVDLYVMWYLPLLLLGGHMFGK